MDCHDLGQWYMTVFSFKVIHLSDAQLNAASIWRKPQINPSSIIHCLSCQGHSGDQNGTAKMERLRKGQSSKQIRRREAMMREEKVGKDQLSRHLVADTYRRLRAYLLTFAHFRRDTDSQNHTDQWATLKLQAQVIIQFPLNRTHAAPSVMRRNLASDTAVSTRGVQHVAVTRVTAGSRTRRRGPGDGGCPLAGSTYSHVIHGPLISSPYSLRLQTYPVEMIKCKNYRACCTLRCNWSLQTLLSVKQSFGVGGAMKGKNILSLLAKGQQSNWIPFRYFFVYYLRAQLYSFVIPEIMKTAGFFFFPYSRF